MKVQNMTEGRPLKLILGIALPLMVGNVFQQLYTVVDASVVGRGIGFSALAAVGAADWFIWLFLGAVQGLAQGFTIPMAQAFGAGNYKELRRYTGNSVLLCAITGLLIAVFAEAISDPVLMLLNTPDDIRPMTLAYMRVLFAGLPLVMAYNLLAGILRALGDGQSPLYAMIAASLTNIALDVLFVFGFGWGVESAAAATIIAQTVSCIFCLTRLRKIEFLRLDKADLQPTARRWGRMLYLGLPLSMQNVLIAIGGMILQGVVNPLGVTFIAGYTAANKLFGLLEIAAVSYGYAMTTYVGQNHGAAKPMRIRKGVHAGALTGILTALGIGVLIFALSEPIVGLFIDSSAENSESAIRIACEYLRLMSCSLPALYMIHIYRSSLQGMGNTLMPMLSGVVEFCMRVGCVLLLPGLIGYWGVFWAEVSAWYGADALLITSYYIIMASQKKKNA